MNGASAPLITAIRGPVVLIVFGALFALDHAGQFAFRQTWPVLFIVYGVMKLLERTLAPKPEVPEWTPPPAPSAAQHLAPPQGAREGEN
jgi:hypothetical protein